MFYIFQLVLIFYLAAGISFGRWSEKMHVEHLRRYHPHHGQIARAIQVKEASLGMWLFWPYHLYRLLVSEELPWQHNCSIPQEARDRVVARIENQIGMAPDFSAPLPADVFLPESTSTPLPIDIYRSSPGEPVCCGRCRRVRTNEAESRYRRSGDGR